MRIWSLPIHPHIEQKVYPTNVYRTNYFWYCTHCSTQFASLRYVGEDAADTWQAKSACCGLCKPGFGELPGSIGWHHYSLGLSEEVLAYELDCELRFIDSPYYIPAKESARCL